MKKILSKLLIISLSFLLVSFGNVNTAQAKTNTKKTTTKKVVKKTNKNYTMFAMPINVYGNKSVFYTGWIKNGKPNGYGIATKTTTKETDTYNGTWKNGYFIKGTITYNLYQGNKIIITTSLLPPNGIYNGSYCEKYYNDSKLIGCDTIWYKHGLKNGLKKEQLYYNGKIFQTNYHKYVNGNHIFLMREFNRIKKGMELSEVEGILDNDKGTLDTTDSYDLGDGDGQTTSTYYSWEDGNGATIQVVFDNGKANLISQTGIMEY